MERPRTEIVPVRQHVALSEHPEATTTYVELSLHCSELKYPALISAEHEPLYVPPKPGASGTWASV